MHMGSHSCATNIKEVENYSIMFDKMFGRIFLFDKMFQRIFAFYKMFQRIAVFDKLFERVFHV